MVEERISLVDVLRAAFLASIAGGLSVFAWTYFVLGKPLPEAIRAVLLLQVFVWALTALNRLAGLVPGLTMTVTVFASTAGAFVGSALGEYVAPRECDLRRQ